MNYIEIENSCWTCTMSFGEIVNYIKIVKRIEIVDNVGILNRVGIVVVV